MNAIVSFRLCSLTDEQLIQAIDNQSDNMFIDQKVPLRHIPARPNKDYDLLIGELIQRFIDLKKSSNPLPTQIIL